jgi:pimeloyl-ACP methyl ester carboxylesterase
MLGYDKAAVVSHDIGIMVAYAYAARYPDKVNGYGCHGRAYSGYRSLA